MVRLIQVGLALLLLSGCAAGWEHATKSTADFYDDDRACQVVSGGAYRNLEPGTERISYESCMWEKGWHKKQTIWFFDPPNE